MTSQSPSIAVVDDDVRLLESIENLFESAGLSVRTFSSAHALLDTSLDGIDCLIADIGMPVMNGYELLDIAKLLRPELPVFLITGRHEIADRPRAKANDIAGFFRKPFDGPALIAAVAGVLRLESGRD